MKNLDWYVSQFKDVRPNRSRNSVSPHKMCLLYAVIDLIGDGIINRNVIYFNDTLKNRFSWHFERLSKSPSDHLDMVNPYFYLRSSSFWHHQLKSDSVAVYNAIKTPSQTSLFNTIEYAYLDEELFELIKNPTAAITLRAALAMNLDTHEEGFEQWARAIGKGDSTIKKYSSALKGSISNWFNEANLTQQNILAIDDYFEIARLINKAQGVKDFVDYNRRGNHMYSAALNLYRAYLDELSDAEAQYDIAVIEKDETIAETTKPTLIQARRGQGRFRERLIAQWQGCALTGYSNISLLMASHIKPWSKSSNDERLDPYNGLLLIPNLDKAFDLHFISFSDKGRILVSEQLGDFHALGINKDMQVKLSEQHLPFMSSHRETYFENLR
ncbi:HNH endonuclease [Pseudidiomarina sp. 1APP75-27a]|uniref:HNH endonuclease n=1 Tax=Pseudidiomarina terrestris TaxID=2820060 RepID=UPI0026519084|nr:MULTISPECIES: HNH endonuclease [unclassified Pseudidiomarina]MDN7138095.1 HNH endonuclease [Pseudidiomarina sp. 1ASP75-14]MEA3588140.1 HNH endonuclease [Pseudidiomarina sp. 1APP75-27a]